MSFCLKYIFLIICPVNLVNFIFFLLNVNEGVFRCQSKNFYPDLVPNFYKLYLRLRVTHIWCCFTGKEESLMDEGSYLSWLNSLCMWVCMCVCVCKFALMSNNWCYFRANATEWKEKVVKEIADHCWMTRDAHLSHHQLHHPLTWLLASEWERERSVF